MAAPRPIRFTTEEVGVLSRLVAERGDAGNRVHVSVVSKLAKSVAERPAPPPISVDVRTAVAAMERVLGVGRVTLGPRPDAGYFARATAGIRKHSLTEEDFVKMARVLQRKGWAPPFSFERTVIAADRLLAEYGAPGTGRSGPATMEDL